MKKTTLLLALVLSVLLFTQCFREDQINLPQNQTINLSINFAALQLNQTSLRDKGVGSKSQKTSSWTHIFEANLEIEFTNISSGTTYYLDYNPAIPTADYQIVLPFGTYQYELVSQGNPYSPYIPFWCEGTIEIDASQINLDLIGYTDWGLVTVDQNHITSAFIRDTDLGDFDMFTAQDHYYIYVEQGRTPIVFAEENVLNTSPSFQLPQIEALIHYNIALNVNELNVASFTLATFEQVDYYFDIDETQARTYVPDDVFEQNLIAQGYDDVLDDYVLTSNISNLEILELSIAGPEYYNGNSENYIKDFTGIQDFRGLREFFIYLDPVKDLDEHTIDNFNLKNMLNLSYFQSIDIPHDNIDLSNNIALTGLAIYNRQLTSIDVSNNTALKTLYIDMPELTSIDLSNNNALTSLDLVGGQLTNIDLSNNNALTSLDLVGGQLTNIDLSNNTALTDLTISYSQLTSIDLSNNNALENLSLSSNQLTNIDLSNNNALTQLRIWDQLTSIDLSNNTALKNLYIYRSELTSIDLSNNTALTYLHLGDDNTNLSCIQVNQTQLDNIPSNWYNYTNAFYSLDCGD